MLIAVVSSFITFFLLVIVLMVVRIAVLQRELSKTRTDVRELAETILGKFREISEVTSSVQRKVHHLDNFEKVMRTLVTTVLGAELREVKEEKVAEADKN
jgi:cell division protein FtsL